MPTILVVDDHAAVRDALCQYFEQLNLATCREAVNGLDAINKALQLRPDLILLDFSMPIMNGIEAAKVLKEMMPRVPLFMLTAHSSAEMQGVASDSGIAGVFQKDDLVPLVECLRGLLSAKESTDTLREN
jgi:two-component system, NarL family, nitrate/nitrite response regulator NarL